MPTRPNAQDSNARSVSPAVRAETGPGTQDAKGEQHAAHAGHRGLFQGHGLRCTKQRELVYQALAATDAHPTAEELFQQISTGPSRLSLATVYNTLDALSDAGLCRRISCAEGRGPCRFDADVSSHAHAVTPGGRVIDLPRDLSDRLMQGVAPDLLGLISERLGMSVTDLSIQVHVRDH